MLTDLLVLSILIALPKRHCKLNWIIPGLWTYAIYFLLSFISIKNSGIPLYSFYELLKMVLMFFLFVAIYNYIIYYRDFDTIVTAFAAIIIYNFLVMLDQKYRLGIYQTGGLFTHRNSASMFANLIAPVFLAYLLNCKMSQGRFYFFLIAFTTSAASVVFALSRGALFFFPIACAITIFFSIIHKLTPKKIGIVTLCICIGTAGAIKGAASIFDRFQNAPESSGKGRIVLAGIAIRMANDKFFGIGLNNFSVKASYPYTYTSEEDWAFFNAKNTEDMVLGLVETTYLLVAAECGWVGLISLLAWFGYYYIQSLRNIFRYKKTPVYYMPIGILSGLTAVFGQSTLEWVLKQTPNFYELMVLFAITASMSQVYKNYKKASKS